MFSLRKLKDILSVQRGAGFILTAMLLPFILAFSGVAVDFGNLYAHHIRLQNACDSAVKAGGAALTEIVVNNKNGDYDFDDDDWDYVWAVCEKYANMNLSQGVASTVLCDARTRGEDKEKSHIFRLRLRENVPYYFLKPLFSMLGYQTYAELEVESFTMVVPDDGSGSVKEWDEVIHKDDGSDIFDNLFTFEKYLNSVNNVQNPDNDKIVQQKWNVSTYDGDVIATSQAGYDKSYNDLRHNTMLQDEAFHGGNETTVAQALAEKLVTEMKLDESYDLTKYYETNIVPQINEILSLSQDKGYVPGEWAVSKKTVTGQLEKEDDKGNKIKTDYYYNSDNNKQNFNSNDIKGWNESGINTVYLNIDNVNFSLSGDIGGSPNDEPLVIIVDGQPNINFSTDMTNSRPIMIVSTRGDTRYNKWSNEEDKFWLQSSGNGRFRGILYAPYSSVGVNDNHHGFDGSVAARNIYLSSQGYYTHSKNYVSGGKGEGSTEVIHHVEKGDPVKSHKMVTGGANFWDEYDS